MFEYEYNFGFYNFHIYCNLCFDSKEMNTHLKFWDAKNIASWAHT